MRSTPRRLALLLRYLGPRWVLRRARFAAQHRFGWFRWRTPARPWRAIGPGARTAHSGETPRFFFSPEDFHRWRPLLEEWDRGAGTLATGRLGTSEADAILAGRLRLFGGAEREIGNPPAWHRDPVTGSEWPRHPHWSRIGDFDHGDIKLVWEASRFGWAFTLVRAFARTDDARYAEGFWRLFESWLDANPPHRGVHWKCGQETALRAGSNAWPACS